MSIGGIRESNSTAIPAKRSENTGPALGNCPVCGAVHVPMACGPAAIMTCSDCYHSAFVRRAIISVARELRLRERSHDGRMPVGEDD